MSRDQYPTLWRFLGAYLHQDWRLDYADPLNAVSDFLAAEPTSASPLAHEIDRVLASTSTSVEAERLVVDLGSFYLPSLDGKDARVWLAALHARCGVPPLHR